nr:hypothetical protein [Burkholderia gladioli]
MSQNTKIEWPDATLAFGMHGFMAWLAKRYSIAHIYSQFGVSGKRQYVMSVQIAPSRVSTMLTCESIAKHHVVSPLLVLVGDTLAQALSTFPVPVGRTIRTAKRHLTNCSTDSRALFNRPLRTPLLARLAFTNSTDSRLGLRGMRSTFESACAPFRADTFLHSRTTVPTSCQTIVPTGIDVKHRNWTPFLATSTSLQARGPTRQILGQIHACLLRRNFQGAFGSNCHGEKTTTGAQLHRQLWWPPDPAAQARVGKRAAGRLLDGVEHNGFPEVAA